MILKEDFPAIAAVTISGTIGESRRSDFGFYYNIGFIGLAEQC